MEGLRIRILSASIVIGLLAVLMFAPIGLRSTAAQAKPAVQKWEFCDVYGGRIEFWTVDGGRTQPIPGNTYSQAVAKLGLDGWELVGSGLEYEGDANRPYSVLYFKRPRQ